MNIKVIGAGAAGNKSAINLIEKNIVSKDDVLLFNSTLKDVPDDWKSIAIKFTNDERGGCGKERDIAKDLCLEFISSERVKILDNFANSGMDQLLILLAATEGGTGSGSSVILAKYIREVLGINVLCFAFTGFEEDGRGLQNTIEYFQDLSDNYIIQSISNKKFLEGTNKFKAEEAANNEFARRLSVIMGLNIIDSNQNIDETDLYKVSTTPGFMTVNYTELNKIKNVNQFNSVITECIDNDKSLDISTKSAKRIAVFINATEQTRDNIDYSFAVIKEKFGTPYEIFTHVQYDEEQPEYISFIVAGLDMPLDEVKEVYNKYKIESGKVAKNKDKFFDFAMNLKGNDEDSMFNVGRKQESNTIDRNRFLNTFKKDISKNINEETKDNKKKEAEVETISINDFLKKY